MANDLNLPAFPPFDPDIDKNNAGSRWEKWVGRLENLFVGLNIDDVGRKRALLLHYAGDRVYDIYEAEKGETAATYTATKKVLKEYSDPKRNIQIDIYSFRTYRQEEGQTLDNFVTELRKKAKDCAFENVDKEILSAVIQNCRSSRLRRRALREADKTLDDILKMGRALEMADSHANTMERGEQSIPVNKIGARKQKTPNKQFATGGSRHPRQRRRTKSSKCRQCGGEYPHVGDCPAKGQVCHACNKPNHFAKMCRTPSKEKLPKPQRQKPVNGIAAARFQLESDSDSSDEEYTYSITEHAVNNVNSKLPQTRIKLNDVECTLLLDTGTTTNILDEATYKKIGTPKLHVKKKNRPKLQPYGGGKTLKVLGSCKVVTETKGRYDNLTFHVVQGSFGALLGFAAATQLELVKIISNVTAQSLSDQYPALFKGIGKYNRGTIKLHIDKEIQPVAQRHRRIPFHLRSKVEKEVNKLLESDIIEKVEGTPTPWVSPIVTPPKKNPDEIRLCVDMREANKAIVRERHVLPTIDELINDMNGASVFSKLDLRAGNHQMELDESSRYITTFSTHVGLFRYKRLNFGISSASEIFQEIVSSVIRDVNGAKNLSDDIIVFGKSQRDHDNALRETFEALNKCGLTLNKEKCEFNKTQITFFGVVFSKNGISPDPKKVQAIKEAAKPANQSELRSFLGMTNYSSRFIPDYVSICEPLRRLTKQDAEWNWTSEQEDAFERLKSIMSSDTVITYYNPTRQINILVDASPVGLGAIMSQDGKVVAYASRALTSVESRYSQTEREALAIVWACEHFDMFIRGAPNVNIITDHKPLECIWQKAKPPLRIERWGLRLQPYKLTIKYEPGHGNPADYMSRHPSRTESDSREGNIAEVYVNFIASQAVPRAMSLDEVKMASANDKTIQKAIEFTRTGQWFRIKEVKDPEIDIEELQAYRSVRDELSVHTDNILLRDHRIVMPSALRDRAIQIAHEGHQGVTKTKAFIRSIIWFPGLNDRVDTAIRDCAACQCVTPVKQMEPLRMSELPTSPWDALSIDFCGLNVKSFYATVG